MTLIEHITHHLNATHAPCVVLCVAFNDDDTLSVDVDCATLPAQLNLSPNNDDTTTVRDECDDDAEPVAIIPTYYNDP
jgi:hypothetical protein